MNKSLSKDNIFKLIDGIIEIPLAYKNKYQALERLAELCKTAMDSYACSVLLQERDKSYMFQAACACPSEKFSHLMQDYRENRGLSKGDFYSFPFPGGSEGLIEMQGLSSFESSIIDKNLSKQYEIESVLICQIKSDDQLLGYINVFFQANQSYTDTQKTLLATLAKQAAVVIERFEYDNQTKLEGLYETIRKMSQARSVNELLKSVLEESQKIIGAPRGWIAKLDYGTGELHILSERGERPARRSLAMGKGISGTALQLERAIRVSDVLSKEWTHVYIEFNESTRSELAIPIIVTNAKVREGHELGLGSKRIGVLNFESNSVGAFSQEDEDVLVALAQVAAIIIDSLEDDQKIAHLRKFETEIVGKRDQNDIMQLLLRGVSETFGFEFVNISLVLPELNRIKTKYVLGVPKSRVELFKKMADHDLNSSDIQAFIVKSKQIEVPPKEDRRFDQKIYHDFRHGQLIRVFVPMIVLADNSAIGTVEAGYNRQFREFIFERDVQLLKDFIDHTVQILGQTKSGLISRITHELTTPIIGIRNNASFLDRHFHKLSHDKIMRKHNDILTDCEILLAHVSGLEHILGRTKPLAKIERTLVFRDIIIKVINQLKPLIAEKSLDYSRIEYNTSDVNKINIYVDRSRLSQVIFNLLTNAIKYAERDGSKFTIRITVDETRDNFILKFKDWGIGIRREYADRIFEEGFRTPEAIQTFVNGSGLGLTISKEIMQELGGDLKLTSPQKPTEFQVTLPKTLKEHPDDRVR